MSLLAALLFSTVARADPGVIVNEASITRSFGPPSNISGYKNTWINFNDCVNDLVLTFPLVETGLPAASSRLQAWVGGTDDCADKAKRGDGALPVCWPAYNGDLPQTQNPNIQLHVRDILSQLGQSTKSTTFTPGTADLCTNNSLPAGETKYTLYFLWLNGSDNTAIGTPAKVALSVDLNGPTPPGSVSAGIGDTALIVNWAASGDTTVQSYTVYCDPPAAGNPAPDATPTTTTTDAGFTLVCVDGGFSDGGFDDSGDALPGSPLDGGCTEVPNSSTTTPPSSKCPSKILIPSGGTQTKDEAGTTQTVGAKQTFIDSAYACGSAGSATSTGTTVKNLVNGTFYTIAVAGTDNFGNVGPLSDPDCKTPQLVVDFWSEYRAAGGLAGGGFCNVDGVGAPASAAPLLVFGGWAVVSMIRRRRKKK